MKLVFRASQFSCSTMAAKAIRFAAKMASERSNSARERRTAFRPLRRSLCQPPRGPFVGGPTPTDVVQKALYLARGKQLRNGKQLASLPLSPKEDVAASEGMPLRPLAASIRLCRTCPPCTKNGPGLHAQIPAKKLVVMPGHPLCGTRMRSLLCGPALEPRKRPRNLSRGSAALHTRHTLISAALARHAARFENNVERPANASPLRTKPGLCPAQTAA